MHRRLLIFDTHPIQYRSPVFQDLASKHPGLKVYFFNDRFDGKRWWFHEVGKIPRQDFDVPMQRGFVNVTLGTYQMSWTATWRALAQILNDEKPTEVALYGYYQPEHWMLRLLCGWKRIPLIFVGETFQS